MSLNLIGGILSSIRQDIKELLITGLILLTLVALVYVFIKFEQTRTWIGSLIVFVMFCSSLVSGYKIYQYFSASGGTVGDVISSIFGSSNAEKVGDYSFKFNNLVFKSTANDNEYKATYQDIYSNETGSFDLDMTKNWNIYINDNVAYNNVIGSNYVFADYVYTFYDENLTELLTDILKIKFVFYKNYYQIDLITNKGETATEFWQSYFTKDNIIVSLKINDYIQDEEINYDCNFVKIRINITNFKVGNDNSVNPIDYKTNIKLLKENTETSSYENVGTFNILKIPYSYRISLSNYLICECYIPISSFGVYQFKLENLSSEPYSSNEYGLIHSVNENGDVIVFDL